LHRRDGVGSLAAVSYDLHIIRSHDWTNASDDPISFEEWISHARADPSLADAGVLSLRDVEPSEQTVFAFGPDGTSFHWWRGEIVVTLAAEGDIARLLPIARALNARVQGDDGEFYE
jgi:hypothetical protein